MNERVKVAAVQMTSTADVEHNLSRALGLATAAVSDGAKLIVFPECVVQHGPGDSKLAHAEALSPVGPLLGRFASFAQAHHVELIVGGFWERSPRPDRVYNTSVHLSAQGAVQAAYRKIHLFDVDLMDGTRLRESDTMVAGQTPVVTRTCAGVVGMSICYDVRFPELYRRLVDQGATLITVPAAFSLTTGKDHWHALLRARAIESQCYLIAAAQTGLHYGDRRSYGHALICDPWGTVIAECGEGEGVAIGYVDPRFTDRVRDAVPSLRHRRLGSSH